MPEDDEHPDRTGAGSDDHAQPSTERMNRQGADPGGTGARDSSADSDEEPAETSESGGESADESGSGRESTDERTTRISGALGSGGAADLDGPTRPRQQLPDLGRTPEGQAPEGRSPEGQQPQDRQPQNQQPQNQPESDPERTQTIPVVPPGPASSFPESDTERTQSFAPVTGFPEDPTAVNRTSADQAAAFPPGSQAMSFGGYADPPPQPPPYQHFGHQFDQQPGPETPPGGSRKRKTLLRAGVTAGVFVVLLALLYVGDLAFSSGQVPRGTVVANVAVGGLDKAAAERKLRAEIGPSLNEPVRLRVGDATASIEPAAAGLSMDWEATLEKAGSQPLNPITRLNSFFTTRRINPVSNVDREKLTAALQEVKPELHREPVEGTIRFEGTEPVAVEPVTGRAVDVQQAFGVVVAEWAGPEPVQLPYTKEPVNTTTEGVRRALNEIAKPAVSGPVTVLGDGKKATITPETIAEALRFEPNGKGGLKAGVDRPTLIDAVKPQLEDTIKPGKDASFVFEGGKPVVQPSVTGRRINWEKSFAPLTKVLRQPGDRSVRAIYEDRPAKFTTEQAKKLGIREQVSTFTTKGFSKDSGVNIRRVAEEVNGAIVKPGETFSLNGHTGIRQKPQGYIASGIIKNGRPAKAVGGGISQFATTLFNASYFAGMKDVEHKEHSYYISRYPLGREATVFQQPDGTSIIDVKFKNVSDSGILIQTAWTPESVTVTFWGTKQYKVETKTSPKSEPVPPKETTVPPGEPCKATSGKPGFTVYNTRIRTDLKTGEVSKNRDKTVYEPQPVVKCAPPPPPPPPPG